MKIKRFPIYVFSTYCLQSVSIITGMCSLNLGEICPESCSNPCSHIPTHPAGHVDSHGTGASQPNSHSLSGRTLTSFFCSKKKSFDDQISLAIGIYLNFSE